MTIDETNMIGATSLPRLTERLRHVARPYSARQLAQITGHHPERVRRYLRGETPCVSFVLAVCEVLGCSADWLLCGRGPMLSADRTRQASLLSAPLPELLDALAWRWLHQPVPDGLAALRASIATLDPSPTAAPPSSPSPFRGPPRRLRRHPPSNGQPPAER